MFVPPAAAQVPTGTIVGTVHDLNGIVPGAIVTIRAVSQGSLRSNSISEGELVSPTAACLKNATGEGEKGRHSAASDIDGGGAATRSSAV